MSTPVLPPPWASEDIEEIQSYLVRIIAALRLGAWHADQFRSELEGAMIRLMQRDATVIDDMMSVSSSLDRELARRFGDYDPADDAPGAPPIHWSGGSAEAGLRELATHSDAGGTTATMLSLNADGSLGVLRMDFGPAAEAALGGDSDHRADIPANYVPALAFALLSEQLLGRLDAVDWVDRYCVQHRIPCREKIR